MQNQKGPIVFRATLRSDLSTLFPTSPTYSSNIPNRYFSLPKSVKNNQPFSTHNTSLIDQTPSENNNNNKGSIVERDEKIPQSLYKAHETNHLLNRIKYLQGIIKEKDRRHKQQLSSLGCRRLDSLQSTSSSTYQQNQRLISQQAKAKTNQLEQRVKQLQKQNQEQKNAYERKIKTMEEYMEMHFVEVQSEIVDQQWKGRDDFFINGFDLIGSRTNDRKKDGSIGQSTTER